jgi:glycosyltransferase involved in cell wall biosynthesis
MTVHRIAVVEFGHSGHQGDYMRHLVRGWQRHRRDDATLHIAVTSSFRKIHADVAAEIEAARSIEIEVTEIDPVAEALLAKTTPRDVVPMSWAQPPGPPADSRGRVRWDIAQRIAGAVGADRLLLTGLDPVLPVLAAHCESCVDVCGIWFSSPVVAEDAAIAYRKWALHQRALIGAALGHPRLQCVFSLDPRISGESWLGPWARKVAALPDPVEIPSPSTVSSRAAARAKFSIPPDRIAALQFGQMSQRKGITALLVAIERLPPDRLRRLSLIMVGPRVGAETPNLEAGLARLQDLGVHVVFHEGFVPEQQVHDLFEATDIVLVAYRQHISMSGVLLRAAAHGHPVLAQSDGLIGYLVKRHRLGVTVNTANPAAMTAALAAMIDSDPKAMFDPEGARAFIRDHEVAAFQDVLYRGLFGDPR